MVDAPHPHFKVVCCDFKGYYLLLNKIMNKVHPSLPKVEQIALEIFVRIIQDDAYWISRGYLMGLSENKEIERIQIDFNNLYSTYKIEEKLNKEFQKMTFKFEY